VTLTEDVSSNDQRWPRRLLIALLLLALAFLLDRHAYELLRTATLYDHWGEMREGLTAAKFLGSGLGTALVVLAVGVIDPRGWRRALALLLVVLIAAGLAGVIKVLSGRERPSHLDQVPGQERLSFNGPARGLRQAPFQSFPSGHTTGSFASATCLARFYPPARVLFYGVAVATGVNRVVKHQHFLSDVVAGALIGHLTALWLLNRPRLRRLWSCQASSS
jgi:membrane-associated phospholipid phosphatase